MAALATAERPTATPEVADLCVLPPYVDSVLNLIGELSIARVRSGSETELARHLRDADLDFFNPREWVQRSYPVAGTDRFVKREWDRAVLPGMVIVAGGYEGRESAERFGSRYKNRLYGWIGGMYANAVGHQLRRELARIERYLQVDPSLKQMSGLLPGASCRVTSGDFEGTVGVVAGDGRNQCLRVRSTLMGAEMEIVVHPSMLEPA